VGAVAWAAPMLTILPASASTDTNPHKLCKGAPYSCDYGHPCGTCSSDVGDGSWCFPYFDSDGNVGLGTVCAEDVFCSEVQHCLKHTDCPRGYACITKNGCTACDTADGVCSKKCRHGLARTRYDARERRIQATPLKRTATSR
jgi:hypothetical protein